MRMTWKVSAIPALLILGGWLSDLPAAVPFSINYQGRLLGTNGVPVCRNVRVDVAIYTNADSGNAVYQECVSEAVPVQNGMYSFAFGADSSALVGALSYPEAWLCVSIDQVPLLPRQRLISVPFAVSAHTLEGKSETQLVVKAASEASLWSRSPGEGFSAPGGLGSSGQVLASAGDGTTRWVDAGLGDMLAGLWATGTGSDNSRKVDHSLYSDGGDWARYLRSNGGSPFYPPTCTPVPGAILVFSGGLSGGETEWLIPDNMSVGEAVYSDLATEALTASALGAYRAPSSMSSGGQILATDGDRNLYWTADAPTTGKTIVHSIVDQAGKTNTFEFVNGLLKSLKVNGEDVSSGQ